MRRYKILYWIILVSFCLIGPSIFIGTANAQTTGQRQYILSSDVIKNFEFDTFNGIPISSGGGVYDNKLKFEVSPTWKTYQDDTTLIYMQVLNGKVYFRYNILLRNTINLVTNVKLTQSSEVLETDSIDYWAALYRHYDVYQNERTQDRFLATMTYNFWDFGNIKAWNGQHNSFSGDLKMSFDLDDTPMPDSMRDASGNTYNKDLEYIALHSAYILNNTRGVLSDDKPTIQVVTPEEYDFDSNTQGSLAGAQNRVSHTDQTGVDLTWDISPSLSDPFLANSFDEGIAPQSVGSSLNPTDKNGDPIWDPDSEHKSMTNASIYYNLGRLGPIVEEYYSTLSYTFYNYILQDAAWFWVDPYRTETPAAVSITHPVALHTKNRYIQSDIALVLDVVAAYDVSVISDPLGNVNLQAPTEYYDELIWTAVVDGFGGGELHYEYANPLQGLYNFLLWIIIAVVVIGGTIIAVKLVKRKGSNNDRVVIYNVPK